MTLQPGPGGATRAERLPPVEIARDALRILWTERDHFLRIGVVPIVIAFAIESWMLALVPEDPAAAPAAGEPADLRWLLVGMLGAIPLALFATNCQRLAALGPSSVSGLGLRWGRRETRFLASAVLISLLAGFAVALPASLYGVFVLGTSALPFYVFAVTLPFYFYLVLRMSLALTAAAVERPGFIVQSWRATRGVGGRFLMAVILVVLPLQLAVYLFSWLLGAIGLYDVAPIASHFLTTLTAYVPAAAMSVVIALVYRRLQAQAGSGM